jgi:CheY-like chemotaxis protein
MNHAMTRPRLVLVEDDKDGLEAFSVFLGLTYTVFGYTSAAEALQAIDAAKPDVLVLDIGMQPVDGMQCLEMIRARPGYRGIPAIAVTGYARDVDRQRFLDAGFQAVVVKPILDHEELTALIDRLAGSRQPAASRTPTRPRRSTALPTQSTAAADLDPGER